MSPDDPRHGTYAGAVAHYRDKERACPACLVIKRRVEKRNKMRIEAGVRNRVPLGLKAYRILTDAGCTQVAGATGLHRNNLYRMRRGGPLGIVLRSSRDKILTVAAPTPVGIQRRLRALCALGYSMRTVGDQAGLHPEPLTRIVRRPVAPMLVKTHVVEAICRVYAELEMRPMPQGRVATRRRGVAVANRWAPPLAWDDIDDPNEAPRGFIGEQADDLDAVVVDRILAGEWRLKASIPERLAVIAAWRTEGRSLNELNRRTGWNAARDLRLHGEQVAS